MTRLLRLVSLTLALLLPAILHAQQDDEAMPAMLVADQVRLDGRTRLVAEGNVEVLQGDTRLRATQITYDRDTEELLISGPIVITNGEDELILADEARLERDLRNGLVRSARVVLDQQLQLAAARLDRVNGRYSQLTRATVSSCKVCGTQAPLWQIRARRVVHDTEAKQLYFDDARFEVKGIPIFYLPRLRLPDPTQTRATGFLIPSIRRNSQLGTGVKIPYFIRLGGHRDLTITPYISPRTRTLEWRYRQAYVNGRITFNGAITRDDLRPNKTRAYITGTGVFELQRDFVLDFAIESTSDNAYISDYSYSDADRLESRVTLSRIRRDEYFAAELAYYHTLRVNENNSTIPSIIGDARYERRLFPRAGGELRLTAETHSHLRYSNLTVDGTDPDTVSDGRDLGRISAGISWGNRWTLPGGIRAAFRTGVVVDAFRVRQDLAARPDSVDQVTPNAQLILRWPWTRQDPGGVTQIIEPMAMVAWSGGQRPNLVNDESTRVEFDEGNLLALSRFPAADRRERGLQTAIGVSWSRIAPEGWDAKLTFGTVLRKTADPAFSASSGLAGTRSDLLVAGQLKNLNGLTLTGRGLFDTGLVLNKAEARAHWNIGRYDLSASYIWLSADPAEARPSAVSEWAFASSIDLGQHWTALVSSHYDIAENQPISDGLGLIYSNECVDVTLSASRSFTSSTIVTPATDFSLLIGLRGFSANTSGRGATRSCN